MVLISTTVLAFSATLTWASAVAGSGRVSYSLLDLPVILAFFGAGVATIGVGAIAALLGRPAGLELSAAAAAAIGGVTFLFVVFAESIVTLVPGSGAAISVRRFALGAGAGPGAWIALATAAVIVVASLRSAKERAVDTAAALRESGTPARVAFGVLLVAVLLVIQLRQEEWIVAEPLGVTLSFSGVALPVISPATYVATWLLAGAVALIAFGLFEAGALAAVLAGWVVSAGAGVTIVAATVVSGAHVDGAHAAIACWFTLLLGVAVAVASGVLLWRREEAR